MASISDLIHGTKPKTAPFEATDPIEMLKKLLSGEITDWPQIQQLGDIFQQTQFDWLSNAIPNIKALFEGGGENVEQAQKNALALQKGQLPPEDIAAIFRSSAGQNLKSGTLFGGMGAANSLRNLGIGTLEGQMKGQDLATSAGNAAQRWMAMAQSTMLPTSAYLYSPEWFTDFMAKQATDKRNVKQLRYNVAAAPDPAWAHRAAMLASVLGSLTGPGGASMGQPISQNPALNFAGGAAGAPGGPGGMTAGATFMGANQIQPGNQNPGFLSNFFGALNNTSSNYQPVGAGGWLGSIFNSPGGG